MSKAGSLEALSLYWRKLFNGEAGELGKRGD
jgi:hypothetical protein